MEDNTTPLWSFGDLRAALQQPPSDKAWSSLLMGLRAVYDHKPEEVRQVWLPYAQSYFERWDDKYRIMPRLWLTEMVDGRDDDPLHLLVRAIFRGPRHGPTSKKMLDVLAESPMLANISILYLTYRVSRTGMMSLFGSSHIGSLKRLVLKDCKVDDEVIASLVGASCCETLDVLRLNQCWLDDAGVAALAEAGVFDHLSELWLGQNQLTDNALFAIAKRELSRLRRLGLMRNDFSDDGLRQLARAPWISQLTTLNLEQCGLTAMDVLPTDEIEYVYL